MPKYEDKAVVEKTAPKVIITRTNVQSLFPARVIKTGLISGEQYVWPEAGSVVSVDERDVADLLAYHIGTTGCCGGSDPNGNTVFQKI